MDMDHLGNYVQPASCDQMDAEGYEYGVLGDWNLNSGAQLPGQVRERVPGHR